ncbi:MAG: hypothetical protein HY818_16360 [Acetobacterium woodii]|nr:hypothetical protein [Acetobacterium woodii]
MNLTVNDIPDIKPEHIKTFKVLAEYTDLLISYDNETILKEKNRLLKKYPELNNDSFHMFFDAVLQTT